MTDWFRVLNATTYRIGNWYAKTRYVLRVGVETYKAEYERRTAVPEEE